MDPIEAIQYRKDSTLALLFAAQQRGWELVYMLRTDLDARNGKPVLRGRSLRVQMDPQHWFELGEKCVLQPADLRVLLMRQDPPFDMEFVYCTYLLEVLQDAGVAVVNDPRALRDLNEKAALTHFADWAPEFVISRDRDELAAFADSLGGAVLKPLDGMGGRSIYHLRPGDTNLPVILEDMTDFGRRTVMAQRYLEEIADGDKRVFVLNGEPVDIVLERRPAPGEMRGNLAAGGTAEVRPLGEAERRIAEAVGPELARRGVLFAGLDVIGNYLTEVNVTSPTGLRETARAGRDLATEIVEAVETLLEAPAGSGREGG